MIKKGLICTVIVLFIVMSISSSSGNIISSDDTTPPVTELIHDPPEPDGHDGWFISDITISFEVTDDLSGVNATYYRINEGEWEKYVEPFKLENDGIYKIEFYSVDNAGNVENVKSRELKIDQTPPEVIFLYKLLKGGKYIKFYLICTDVLSGLDRAELYINDGLVNIDYDEPFEWIYLWSEIFGQVKIKTVVYDKAGNSDYDDTPEYRSVNRIVKIPSQNHQSTQQFTNPLMLRLIERFPNAFPMIRHIFELQII